MTLVIQPINNEILLQQEKDFISEFLDFFTWYLLFISKYVKSKMENK